MRERRISPASSQLGGPGEAGSRDKGCACSPWCSLQVSLLHAQSPVFLLPLSPNTHRSPWQQVYCFLNPTHALIKGSSTPVGGTRWKARRGAVFFLCSGKRDKSWDKFSITSFPFPFSGKQSPWTSEGSVLSPF